ncbi:polysaccharide biosynthesis/export family protein [Roseivirga sp. UBA838]|uniref:polysaccharide biosynthesis/export family protein n=1 Tax=Roseivirga sp. UBA838 TaxID=1947393 RepID=UPI00257ACB1C|nr:polysaccharide biosynthesis/export family protein [Roseivirga sp. UBA838]|tara:strand:- start:59633 stop:60484 length:852 start_codon:yes stop_codon:yes gene_type:complete
MKTRNRKSPLALKLMGFLFVVLLVSSCIPNEKIVYLQNKEDDPALANDTLIELKRIDYRLQPNDILLINFFSKATQAVEDYYPIFQRRAMMGLGGGNNNNGNNILNDPYLTGYHIDKNGEIEINGIGRIKAAGLTTDELKYSIEDTIRTKDGVLDILVGVKLQGIPFTIYGEVGSPGSKVERVYELTLLEAIASSGDLTLNANREHVILLRDYPDGVRIHEIDVTGRAIIPTEYWFIQPDDVIYVPPLKIRELGVGTSALQNLSVIVSVISSTTLIISLLTRF